MKQFVAIFIFLCFAAQVNAQYTQQLQQQKQGQGTVTVTQSREIDDLVNGKKNTTPTPQKTQTTSPSQKKQSATTPQKTQSTSTSQSPQTTTVKPQQTPQAQVHNDSARPSIQDEGEKARQDSIKAARERQERQRREAERREAERREAEQEASSGTTTVDYRKKVMRRSHKQKGYRVQVFSGGNKREDRIKAEQISAQVKAAFPDQPIYTHFYSPRWICRMGNFKTYDEAAKILKKVKAMGYKTACVVKGTISVQY